MKTALALIGIIPLLYSIGRGLPLHSDESEKGFKITFHTTSVSAAQTDDPECDPNKCSVTRFTVDGYAENQQRGTRTEYVLTCDEYLVPKPTPHVSLACSSVHAGREYEGRVIGNSVSFWPLEKYTPPPMRETYSIVSEREVKE